MERFVLCVRNSVIFIARVPAPISSPPAHGLLYYSIFIFTERAPCYQIGFKLKIERMKERKKKKENCAMSYIQSKLIKKKVMPCFKLNPTSFFLVQSSDLLPFSPSPDTFPFFGFIPLVPGTRNPHRKIRSFKIPVTSLPNPRPRF